MVNMCTYCNKANNDKNTILKCDNPCIQGKTLLQNQVELINIFQAAHMYFKEENKK